MRPARISGSRGTRSPRARRRRSGLPAPERVLAKRSHAIARWQALILPTGPSARSQPRPADPEPRGWLAVSAFERLISPLPVRRVLPAPRLLTLGVMDVASAPDGDSPETGTRPPRRLGFVPALDGVRGVAVLVV